MRARIYAGLLAPSVLVLVSLLFSAMAAAGLDPAAAVK